jgi:hypothetical protein
MNSGDFLARSSDLVSSKALKNLKKCGKSGQKPKMGVGGDDRRSSASLG